MSYLCNVPRQPDPKGVEEYARWQALEAERRGILEGMHQEHDSDGRYRAIEREQAALRAAIGEAWFAIHTRDPESRDRFRLARS